VCCVAIVVQSLLRTWHDVDAVVYFWWSSIRYTLLQCAVLQRADVQCAVLHSLTVAIDIRYVLLQCVALQCAVLHCVVLQSLTVQIGI